MAKKVNFTPEHEAFIRDNYLGISRVELTRRLHENFSDTDASVSFVYKYCRKMGYKSGLTGHFLKGHVPAIKGKKYLKKPSPTDFKKGQAPHNKKPVGYEYISKSNGYIWVKVADRNFKAKHRLIWEAAKGPIPPGHCLKFIDNNPLNCDLSNLLCVPKGVVTGVIKGGGVGGDKDINRTVILTKHLEYLVEGKRK